MGASIFNFIIIFSGLPTSWKKVFITLASLAILGLGYLMRAQAKRRALRVTREAEIVERARKEELEQLTEEIAEDVTDQVEQEIDRM